MFKLHLKEGRARRGSFETVHGTVQTPVFMNVGTCAAVKGGIAAEDLREVGCQVELSNTYHLHLRPGDALIKGLGGLHRFMNWDGPILTDSGGFQVFSLSSLRKITEEGVHFASHIDGRRIFMGPEESMRIQSNLGSTIAMAFDECVANPSPYDYVRESTERTARWLLRCREEMARLNSLPDTVNPSQLLFGINQGGTYEDLRIRHMKEIAKYGLDGYAIGGLAVGEETEEMYRIIDAVEPFMPEDRPRYLMGVGTPVNILNEKYATDGRPIDPGCGCPACRAHSRAYIRHLLKAEEMLGMRLAVLHNLYFYNELMSKIRAALDAGAYGEFYRRFRTALAERCSD